MEEESADRKVELSQVWDALLSKYVSVWLWSILFGTTTGVLYSFLSFRLDRWGGLAVLLVIPALASLAFALMSWFYLYMALSRFLIPRFILHTPEEELKPKHFAYCLNRALVMFIGASALRAVASLLELMLSSVGRS